MKIAWFTLWAALLGLSVYPEPVVLNGVTIDAHQFWVSDLVTTQIVKALLVVSVIGFLRDLKKHPGHIVSRLMKRTFVMLGAILSLYIPWDVMVGTDNLGWQITITVIGAIVWGLGALFLFGDTEEAKQMAAANLAKANAAKSTAEEPVVAQAPVVTPAKPKPATKTCVHCACVNEPGAVFCGGCGSPLPA